MLRQTFRYLFRIMLCSILYFAGSYSQLYSMKYHSIPVEGREALPVVLEMYVLLADVQCFILV